VAGAQNDDVVLRFHFEFGRECMLTSNMKANIKHFLVTLLKAAGVSDFIAREIVGHESATVTRQYSHLSTEHKRNAMRNLPDVTNG